MDALPPSSPGDTRAAADRDDFFAGDAGWDDTVEVPTDEAGESLLPRVRRAAGSVVLLEDGQGRRRLGATVALVAVGAAALVAVGLIVAHAFDGGGSSDTTPATTSVAPTTAPATTPAPTTTTPAPTAVIPAGLVLAQGDKGPAVRRLQRALRRRGHDPGPVDGTFGPQTREAVIAFQQSAGITADGIAGPETARALARELARPG